MNLLDIDSLPPFLRNASTSYSFNPGERLFRQGDRPRNFFIVEAGRIKLVRNTIEGRMVILQVTRRGESLGENTFISDVYSCTAIAEVASRVIAYPQPLLREVVREYPELLAENLREMLVTKIQSLEISLELLQTKTAHQRLLQYLRYQASSNVVNFDQPLKEVAAELDLAPRSLSRALARLEQDGRISRQTGSITLLTI
ncbi:MAG: Crp/Fnr family transcriptional regulator [Cyanobacteriota bacterium]|nr:Crp/Fnr family transcriptional regulator [Cyanobacteriota bacterium]